MKLPITVPARSVRKSSAPSSAPRWFDKYVSTSIRSNHVSRHQERKGKLCLALSVICVVLTWILVRLELLPGVSTSHQQSFILVIDAGSTGTRLYVKIHRFYVLSLLLQIWIFLCTSNGDP